MKQDQKELPKELFAVKMYALVTSQPKIQNSGKRRRPRNSPRMIRSWRMPGTRWPLSCWACLVMYCHWIVLKVAGTSVFAVIVLFLYILFLYKHKFLLGEHVHIILRWICWSSELGWLRCVFPSHLVTCLNVMNYRRTALISWEINMRLVDKPTTFEGFSVQATSVASDVRKI